MSNKKVSFTIGCDPEFFLQKQGSYVAALPFVYGTKGDPQDLGRGNGVMLDNVALEFCTQPAKKEAKFVKSVKQAISSIRNLLPEDVHLVAMPSASFPEAELTHPMCQEFGCDPDFNAYTNEVNPKPELPNKTFRSCGGHIHVGHSKLCDHDLRLKMVKLMDAIHGLAATILDDGAAAVERRKLYGKAGCFRPTEYGLEYRTLSNFWLKSPELVKLMYRFTRDAVALLTLDKANLVLDNLKEEEVQKAINTGDKEKALDLFAKFVVPSLTSHTNDLFMEVTKHVYSFESSWRN